MNCEPSLTHTLNSDDKTFDELMADLCVLITHHSLTHCDNALPNIIDRIHSLTHHSDIECYPHQLKVLLKMQTLWRTRLFKAEVMQLRH